MTKFSIIVIFVFLGGCCSSSKEIQEITWRNLAYGAICELEKTDKIPADHKCVENGQFSVNVAMDLMNVPDEHLVAESLNKFVFLEGLSKQVLSTRKRELVAIGKSRWPEKNEDDYRVLVIGSDLSMGLVFLSADKHIKIISDLKSGHSLEIDSLEEMTGNNEKPR